MKLPFDFATKLLLRLVFPGALYTAIFWPLIITSLGTMKVQSQEILVAPCAILFLGWLNLLLDMPIYMILEGRRWWPSWLTKVFLSSEERRLVRIQRDANSSSQRIANEMELLTRCFPLNDAGQPEVRHPTRLGNLVTAFETYPHCKYGLDGTFGWYRLWLKADKDLRGELDDQQAIADSGLYVSFGLGVGAAMCVIYILINEVLAESIAVLPPTNVLVVCSLLSMLFSFVIYRVTLEAQAQYGELFRAFFDINISDFPVEPISGELSERYGEAISSNTRSKRQATVRFLKWHVIRRGDPPNNEPVERWLS